MIASDPPPAPRKGVFQATSLRARLLLLVVLAMAPMVAMTVATGMRERAHAIDAARENLQRLANLAAANEAKSIDGAMQILRDLSSVPTVLKDRDGCGQLMADILSKNSDYVNFGVIEMNGNVSCSAIPMAQSVNLADRPHFKRAVSERRFIAGNYVFGRVARKHTINLTYPVTSGTEVVAVLFAAIDLSELDKFVADIQLPAGSLLWTADAEGTVISRRPDSGPWFGKPIPPSLWKNAREHPRPTSLIDGDGTERIYAFARVGGPMLSDYTVMIGVPQEHIVARAQSDQLLAAVGLSATMVFALLAAWFGGDALIARRVRTLAATANRIASGTLGTRTGMRYGNEEISELARSLDEMAAALEKKESERDAAEALLVAADKRKDEFLAMLAHELRNPLAPISAGAHILRQVHAQDPVVARTANIIVRQTTHMTRLIDDLLDVSRVTRGLVELKKETLEFGRIVHDAIEQVGPLMTSRKQQLEVDLPDTPLQVDGDHKRLVQVVANLLNNAAKYTPEGGHIRVRLEGQEEQLLLTVADDGIGMQPELIARVFDLFTQGERTSDRSQGGLGLGLALVRTLVQLHGGSVQASSAGPGQGSVFSVALPCVRLRAPEPPERAPAPAGSAARLRCLVVDDNEDAAQMLSMFLEAAGHYVVVAHSAAEALVMAHALAPHLCLLDIGLPDFDGNELVARLRKAPESARATMVAVSGYGRQDDKALALEAGFDEYFVKPFDTAELLALVNRLARERSMAATAAASGQDTAQSAPAV